MVEFLESPGSDHHEDLLQNPCESGGKKKKKRKKSSLFNDSEVAAAADKLSKTSSPEQLAQASWGQQGTEKFSHNNNDNIHSVLPSSRYANFSRLLSISIFEKQTRCAATLLTRARASVNQCLIFHICSHTNRSKKKKNKRTQCLIFHLVCVEKWGGAKAMNGYIPKSKLA